MPVRFEFLVFVDIKNSKNQIECFNMLPVFDFFFSGIEFLVDYTCTKAEIPSYYFSHKYKHIYFPYVLCMINCEIKKTNKVKS